MISACTNENYYYLSQINSNETTRSDVAIDITSLTYPMPTFIDTIYLSETDQYTVNGYLSDMQNEFGKWYLPLFEKITTNKISKIYRSNIPSNTSKGENHPAAAYYTIKNILVFSKEADIRYNSLCEELIHAGQHRIYKEGITQYGKKEGASNIEFEAKLVQDIINCINDLPFSLGEGVDNYIQYTQWILDICENKNNNIIDFPSLSTVLTTTTEKDSLGYYDMAVSFAKKYPIYDFDVDRELKPEYIDYIYKSINNIK